MSRAAALFTAVLLAVFALHVLAKETRLVPIDAQWAVEGSFKPGGIYPISDGTALARSDSIGPSPMLWGSWLGADADRGTLRSPSFSAPTLLALLVTGHPNAPGNSLFLERVRDGARHSLRSSSRGLRWQDERFWLPREFRGEAVRLVAVDGATARPGWLGLSTPRAITPAAWILSWAEETAPIPLNFVITLFCFAPVPWLLARAALATASGQAVARAAAGVTGPASALGVLAVLAVLAVLGLAGVFLFHLGVLHRYSVDIPYMEEWRHLSSGLASEFSGQWIWSRHEGQRIVFTKLHTWLLYRSGGWNLQTQILQNFLLYGAMLASVFAFSKRNARGLKAPMLLACFVFLLSFISHDNHQWGMQSHIHFSLLFLVLGLQASFRSEAGFASALAAAALGVAAIVSSATGAASVAGALFVFATYTFFGGRPDSERGSGKRLPRAIPNSELARLAIIAIPIGLAIALGSGGYADDSTAAEFTRSEFWRYALNLVSGGFGVSSDSALLGGFWLTVALIPFAARLASTRGRLAAEEWPGLALLVALLAGLLATAHARAELGAWHAKSSQHAELAMLLLPLTLVAWSSLLATHATAKRRAIGCFFALLALASLDDWSTEPYRLQRIAREHGIRCATLYYEPGEEGSAAFCPEIARHPIPRELDRARELELHFYRNIQSQAAD